MKVLLDECVPRQLRNSLPQHECRTVPELGLAGKKNGELLSAAEAAGFEVFVTLDRGIQYEQSLGRRKLAVILIRAKSSRVSDLLPHMFELLQRLPFIKAGQVLRIGLA